MERQYIYIYICSRPTPVSYWLFGALAAILQNIGSRNYLIWLLQIKLCKTDCKFTVWTNSSYSSSYLWWLVVKATAWVHHLGFALIWSQVITFRQPPTHLLHFHLPWMQRNTVLEMWLKVCKMIEVNCTECHWTEGCVRRHRDETCVIGKGYDIFSVYLSVWVGVIYQQYSVVSTSVLLVLPTNIICFPSYVSN